MGGTEFRFSSLVPQGARATPPLSASARDELAQSQLVAIVGQDFVLVHVEGLLFLAGH